MTITSLKRVAGVLLAASVAWGVVGSPAARGQSGTAPAKLSRETFAELARQIKPQSGESRWMEIPWLIDVHAARRQAAAEGKPLFIYSGGGAIGIGGC